MNNITGWVHSDTLTVFMENPPSFTLVSYTIFFNVEEFRKGYLGGRKVSIISAFGKKLYDFKYGKMLCCQQWIYMYIYFCCNNNLFLQKWTSWIEEIRCKFCRKGHTCITRYRINIWNRIKLNRSKSSRSMRSWMNTRLHNSQNLMVSSTTQMRRWGWAGPNLMSRFWPPRLWSRWGWTNTRPWRPTRKISVNRLQVSTPTTKIWKRVVWGSNIDSLNRSTEMMRSVDKTSYSRLITSRNSLMPLIVGSRIRYRITEVNIVYHHDINTHRGDQG